MATASEAREKRKIQKEKKREKCSENEMDAMDAGGGQREPEHQSLYRQILIYALAYHDIHGEDGETDFYIFIFLRLDRPRTSSSPSIAGTCLMETALMRVFRFVSVFFVNSFSLFEDNKFR